MSRFMALVAALAVSFVLVAPSAAAPPAGASIQIEKQATLLSPSTIAVSVVVQCAEGTQAFVNLGVSQQQTVGPNTTGNGFSPIFVCDGTNQTINLVVSGGPFTTGDAFATALIGNGFNRVFDERVITIS
jgi:hypothetical protein